MTRYMRVYNAPFSDPHTPYMDYPIHDTAHEELMHYTYAYAWMKRVEVIEVDDTTPSK